MVDHARDSWIYMMSAVTAMSSQELTHDHLLMKDPRRLGWRCQVERCGFFKPAHEFDAMRIAA